jgi:hypothetical protein
MPTEKGEQMIKKEYDGRIYECRLFTSVKATNEFLAKNPGFGVLSAEKHGIMKDKEKIFVARNSDMGIRKSSDEPKKQAERKNTW